MKINTTLPEKSVILGLVKSPWGHGFELVFLGRQVADLCAPAMELCPDLARCCESSFINLWRMLTVPALECKKAFLEMQNATTSTLSRLRLQQSRFYVHDEYTALSNDILAANMLMHYERLTLAERRREMKQVDEQTANFNGFKSMVFPSMFTLLSIWIEALFKSHMEHHITLWNERRLRGVPICSNRFLNFT